MARSKNATALFEVIHTAKKPPKSSTTVSVPTPKWWHKSKPSASPKAPGADTPEPAGTQGSWLAAAAKRGAISPPVPPQSTSQPIEDQTVFDEVVKNPSQRSAEISRGMEDPVAVNLDIPAVSEPAIEASPKPTFADRFANRFARKPAAPASHPVEKVAIPDADPVFEPPVANPVTDAVEQDVRTRAVVKTRRPSKPSKDDVMAVDRFAKEVRLRLSYAGLISLGLVAALVLVLMYLIGLHSRDIAIDSQNSTRGSADSEPRNTNTGMLIGGAPMVLPEFTKPAGTRSEPLTAAESPRSDVLAVTRHPRPPTAPTPTPPPPAEIARMTIRPDAVREVGATYIVVQSYDDPQMAQRACDFLNKAGVPCSLVQGLNRFAPRDWYSVVGLYPFTKNDATLNDYERDISALGPKFSSKVLDQFQPKPYPWRADSENHASGD